MTNIAERNRKIDAEIHAVKEELAYVETKRFYDGDHLSAKEIRDINIHRLKNWIRDLEFSKIWTEWDRICFEKQRAPQGARGCACTATTKEAPARAHIKSSSR